MTLIEAINELKLKFTSGNEIQVNTAIITRREWEPILMLYQAVVDFIELESDEFAMEAREGLEQDLNQLGMPLPEPPEVGE